MPMHFFNHSKLAWSLNVALLILALILQNFGAVTDEANLIRRVMWVIFVACVSLHVAHCVWLKKFTQKLDAQGYPRGYIAKRVAEIECQYPHSLLALHMWSRSNDSFEKLAVSEYFRTIRFKGWKLTPTKSEEAKAS